MSPEPSDTADMGTSTPDASMEDQGSPADMTEPREDMSTDLGSTQDMGQDMPQGRCNLDPDECGTLEIRSPGFDTPALLLTRGLGLPLLAQFDSRIQELPSGDVSDMVTWSLEPEGLAIIDGRFLQALQVGEVTLTASIEGLSVSRRVTIVDGFNRVAAGRDWTCARHSSRGAWCWGDNTSGQLGNGTSADSPSPVHIPDAEWDHFDVGDDHGCGLTRGELACWGLNTDGRLGVSQPDVATSPVSVGATDDFDAVYLGAKHSCAVEEDGLISCWGDNSSGQLGLGEAESVSAPTLVPTTSLRWRKLSLGGTHTCGVTLNNDLYCWGSNRTLQISPDAATTERGPVKLNMNARVFDVSAGYSHTCAIDLPGEVSCWGDSSDGKTGSTTSDAGRPAPINVPGVLQFIGLTRNAKNHTCAWTRAGGLWCWGANDSAQLGNGGSRPAARPVQVALPGPTASSVVGLRHTCALSYGGRLACWGGNDKGQVGNRTTTETSVLTPTEVRLPTE